ncbi:unnamed protein product, partial [Phaeothamnion confervicola]
ASKAVAAEAAAKREGGAFAQPPQLLLAPRQQVLRWCAELTLRWPRMRVAAFRDWAARERALSDAAIRGGGSGGGGGANGGMPSVAGIANAAHVGGASGLLSLAAAATTTAAVLGANRSAVDVVVYPVERLVEVPAEAAVLAEVRWWQVVVDSRGYGTRFRDEETAADAGAHAVGAGAPNGAADAMNIDGAATASAAVAAAEAAAAAPAGGVGVVPSMATDAGVHGIAASAGGSSSGDLNWVAVMQLAKTTRRRVIVEETGLFGGPQSGIMTEEAELQWLSGLVAFALPGCFVSPQGASAWVLHRAGAKPAIAVPQLRQVMALLQLQRPSTLSPRPLPPPLPEVVVACRMSQEQAAAYRRLARSAGVIAALSPPAECQQDADAASAGDAVLDLALWRSRGGGGNGLAPCGIAAMRASEALLALRRACLSAALATPRVSFVVATPPPGATEYDPASDSIEAENGADAAASADAVAESGGEAAAAAITAATSDAATSDATAATPDVAASNDVTPKPGGRKRSQ